LTADPAGERADLGPAMPVTWLLPAVKLLWLLVRLLELGRPGGMRCSGDVSCAAGSSGPGPRAVAVRCGHAPSARGSGPGAPAVTGSGGHGC